MAFADLKKTADSPSQVRKVLEAVAFMAPYSAESIDTLTGPTGEITTLPEDYFPVGLVTSDGYVFGGDTESESVTPFGYVAPVREDITSQTNTVSFTAYEVYRKDLLALAYGLDLSDVTKAVSGEVKFDRPALPEKAYYRLVVIGKDGSGASEIYRAKVYHKVAISAIPEEAWGADALSFEISLTAYVDDELGTAVTEYIAGPGAKTDTDLGYTAGV